MRMTFTQLRYLAAIVDYGFSISQAARMLHTSQPGISRQIRLLEQQLGATILARKSGRIIGLTESGERVMHTVRRVINDMESLSLMSQEYLAQESGTLTIGTLHTYALSLLPKALADLRSVYPHVLIDVQQVTLPQAAIQVQDGELDVAITIGEPPVESSVIALHVADIPLQLLVPDGHELTSKSEFDLADLLDYPMICLRSSTTSWGVSSVYKANGYELRPAAYAMDASVMRSLVAHGLGIAVLPSVLPTISGTVALSVSHLFPPSSINALINPNRFLRGYVYAFIEKLAPKWTRNEIDFEIRNALFGTAPNRS